MISVSPVKQSNFTDGFEFNKLFINLLISPAVNVLKRCELMRIIQPSTRPISLLSETCKINADYLSCKW